VIDSVLRCGLSDADRLLKDLRNMHREIAPFGQWDEETCVNFLEDSLSNHIVLKRVKGDELLGHMMLRIESHWYTKEKALYEYYVYVPPQHRRTRTAFDLYKVAKATAKVLGLPFFYGTFRNPKAQLEKVNKFLKRQGGELTGVQYFIGVEE